MSETEVLGVASKSLSAMPMPSPPDVQAIMARGRARRRRRLTGVAGLSMAAAAGVTLVLGLTGVLSPSPAHGTGTIRTVSFTLVSNANGTATLTLNPKELLDAPTLQNDLQQYGIPALVTSGRFCSSDPAPQGFTQVMSFYPNLGPGNHVMHGVRPTFTFHPAAMPAGTELSFGIFQYSSGEQQADFMLINSSSYTCTGAPPQGPPNAGAQLRIGPARS